MFRTRMIMLIILTFLAGSIYAQTESFSLRWLDLLESDWPDFERADSREAAAKLMAELKDELTKKKGNACECNYLLCEMNYYLKAYDSSVKYGKEALKLGVCDSGMIHYKMALSYAAMSDFEQAVHSIDQALAANPGDEVYYCEKKKLMEQQSNEK